MLKKILLFFFIASFSTLVLAQERSLVPQGAFLKDSVKVGEPVQYVLKYAYSKDKDLVFPDSSYDFFPFEFVDKKFFPTVVDSTMLTDSAVYTLVTFETDPVLYLSTPVFVLEDGDTVKYFSNIDSVYYHHLLDSLPQKPQLLSNTNYANVSRDFNYIYFLIGFGVLLLLTAIVAIIFGRKIVNWLKIKRLEKAHRKFNARYDDLQKHLSASGDRQVINNILKLWKGYMEKLEQRPFTKLTTKEISFIYQDNELNSSLKEIDKMLYGNRSAEKQNVVFGNLIDFSYSRLRLKIEELRNE